MIKGYPDTEMTAEWAYLQKFFTALLLWSRDVEKRGDG